MITGFLFTFLNATVHAWTYIIVNLLLRVEEVCIIFCGLQILSKNPLSFGKKRPVGDSSIVAGEGVQLESSGSTSSENNKALT
jgi:hypothetical protein